MTIPTVTEAVQALIADALACKLDLGNTFSDSVIPLNEVRSLNFYDGNQDIKDTDLDA